MDSQTKQKALEDAIEITKIAVGATTESEWRLPSESDAAGLLRKTYKTLCELYEDAMSEG